MLNQLQFPGHRVVEDNYFRADETFPGVWKISQPWFRPDSLLVYCFLIVGEKYAIVYDTMFGYGNLRKFCEKITDLPIVVVNSHFHGDHAAGNFDFDVCYIHPYDLPGIYQGFAKTPEALLERAKATAKPECVDMLKVEDMCMPKPMKAFPIYDGDIFDIGGRQLQVIHVGGHSPGSIMLLDPTYELAYSGDTCNNDTIVTRGDPIETYLAGLRHLRRHTDGIKYLFGGHEDFPATIIDEGIELCERVLNRTDDAKEYTFDFVGRQMTALFAAEMKSFYRRTDGKDMNMQYSPDNLFTKPIPPRIITEKGPAAARIQTLAD